MSPGGKTAADVLNTYTAAELASILQRRYGEERFATRIADRIVAARADTPWTALPDGGIDRRRHTDGRPPPRRPPGEAHFSGTAY